MSSGLFNELLFLSNIVNEKLGLSKTGDLFLYYLSPAIITSESSQGFCKQILLMTMNLGIQKKEAP